MVGPSWYRRASRDTGAFQLRDLDSIALQVIFTLLNGAIGGPLHRWQVPPPLSPSLFLAFCSQACTLVDRSITYLSLCLAAAVQYSYTV